jgi:protein SCO1/2
VVLIYFGYTSCADVCPVALAKVGMAMRELGPEAKNVQPLFISVDTKRDTPELLRSYSTYFHPAILGLTGTQDEVEAVARQYRAPVFIRKSNADGFYAVDHSAKLYLVDPDGILANILPDASSPEKITYEIRDLLRN